MALEQTIKLLPLTDEECKALQMVLMQITNNISPNKLSKPIECVMMSWILNNLKTVLKKLNK